MKKALIGKKRPKPRTVPALAAILAVLLAAADDPVHGQGAGAVAAPEGREPLVERPVPGPVVAPPFFASALERGTRSVDGAPGPGYWRNTADYDIDARLDPATGRLVATGTIRYTNDSPDALRGLLMHLHLNLHAPGVRRNEPQEITGGIELTTLRVRGRDVGRPPADAPVRQIQGTLMAITLDEAVRPGETVELEVGWEATIPQNSAGRMGWSEREAYFVAYWFPKMAVYDDLRGWDAEPYLGSAEFYDEFGDYEVSLTVPVGWSVMATGELRNPSEVYAARTLERLASAASADTIVHVATAADRADDAVTTPGTAGELTYRFAATEVRDFAWTASDVQLWDATSAVVPDRDGDGVPDRVMIHSFWRPDRAPLWAEQALYGKHAVEHHSRYTGFAYPWSHMTSVEGADIIGGGMEFPMLTVMGPYTGRPESDLYNVTSHEIAHMWIPMIVGTNEKRHAWMDEGSTTFLENQGRPGYWPGTEAHALDRESYLLVARAGAEQSMMRHGDYYQPGPGYGTASYPKPATLLVTLRNLLGEEAFLEAYRGFIADWAYRHPAPWDFFNAFEAAAGRDLDWFWTSYYYRTWALDHAVVGVETRNGAPVVVIEDQGFAPMPVRLRIETTGGGTLEREVPVTTWLEGRTRAEVELPASVGRVTRIEIDPDQGFPDVDRSDNVWVVEAAGGS